MKASTMVVRPFRVLQANVMKCYASHQELIRHFISNDFSIALISEPYVGSNSSVASIKGIDIYQFTYVNRVKACVLIKQSFCNSLGVTQLSTPNLAVVKLKADHRDLFIASAYIEPDSDTSNTFDAINKFLHKTRRRRRTRNSHH